MSGYRNIDSLLRDARTIEPLHMDPSSCSADWSGIPKISNEALLCTMAECSIKVNVSWVSGDKETIRGRITIGSVTERISEQELVEFSRKKITGIVQSSQK